MEDLAVPPLVVGQAGAKNRGLFAQAPIKRGVRLCAFEGFLVTTAELKDEYFALQVDVDLWLCSYGDLLDDCSNHSCAPNAGFITGEPVLYALRDIAAGEEICWDYSTSISEPGWSLECLCGAESCRGIIRPWGELSAEEQARLRPIALKYLIARTPQTCGKT